MSFQITFKRGRVFAEVALVRFFTTVCCRVSTQITSFRDCIVAKIAFVALLANVCFQMTFRITQSGRCDFSPLSIFPATSLRRPDIHPSSRKLYLVHKWEINIHTLSILINMYIKNSGPRAGKVTLVAVIRLITIMYF